MSIMLVQKNKLNCGEVSHSDPNLNHLLAALPQTDFARIRPLLEDVYLPVGEMLYEPGQHIHYAYFPTTAIVSLHYVTETGASAETAGVGNDGVVGVTIFMGGDSTSSSAVVQTAGSAYRIEGKLLKQEFGRNDFLSSLLLRYVQALMTQMSQSAACNRHHTVEQRLSRWLLLTLDRSASNDLVTTQELVASMLGVRREGITEAAGNLQRAGFICSRRGHITVLKREGLEQVTCECYGVVRKEMSRLLHDVLLRQGGLENQYQNT